MPARYDLQSSITVDLDNNPKPGRPAECEEWLANAWNGDKRELRRGRFLQQQQNLLTSFADSPYFQALHANLEPWAAEYRDKAHVDLFAEAVPTIDLKAKPWESFINRVWRHNVHNNTGWPEPPHGGWLSPDCWFEDLWDIVRTRIVVRYLDGVEFMARKLVELGADHGLSVERKTHAQEWGYYAMHVTVPQAFKVQTLNLDDDHEWRASRVEIQLTTQLHLSIDSLTHGFFEKRREQERSPDYKWQWDYESPEFTPYYLGHLLHYLEGMIMRVRDDVHQDRRA